MPAPALPGSSDLLIATAEVPVRFHAFLEFLRKQHVAGISRVGLTPIGEHVKIRRSETGEQLRVKRFVEDAQRSGIITCGGVGDKMWAALTVPTRF